jgi:predicted transglutaminase-like cysteine proteinase
MRTAALAGGRVIVLLLAIGLLPGAAALDLDRLLAALQRFGGQPAQFRDWQRVAEEAQGLADAEDKLKRVNNFFNRRLQFGEDQQIWGQSDYWATPMETLAKSSGDCEDFAIAKYFTLRAAGIADDQLRLVYVRARIGGPDSRISVAHMALAYYPSPDAEPLVLDNLISEIRPAGRRPDLQPVFSFNSQGIWQGSAGTRDSTGGGRLSRWQDLLQRARKEGFE